jgi:uncharacterized repeat protein (TIGR03803 family)
MQSFKAGRALCAAAAMFAFPVIANAGTFATIYTFTGGNNDGASPEAGLIYQNGTLYGTTSRGGPSDAGTVFAFNPQTGTNSVITTAMGLLPFTPLLYADNHLFGSTSAADNGQGNIFQVNPKTGAAKDLYAFPRGPDLAYPSGLVKVAGSLYGTAVNGGSSYNGSIFEYNIKTKTFTTLYNFSGGADGKNPNGVIAKGGFLYGVTTHGGSAGDGVIFKLDLATNTETTLYNFSGTPDGSGPSGLTFHGGLIYGTALFGGANGDGTVFSFDPTTSKLNVVYNLVGGASGCVPFGQPVIYKGLLYSAAGSCGSTANQGALFEVNLVNGKQHTLKVFTNGPDGVSPGGSLLLNQGIIYGTTCYGGQNNAGTIFQYVP